LKSEVRSLARELALPVAEKPDSQDICFVPKGHYSSVIGRLKPGALQPGDIVDPEGRVLGRHEGIVNYTIGQRRGLGIPGKEPLFVIKLDAPRNRVVVGPRDFLRTTGLMLKNVNWLGDTPLTAAGPGMSVRARLRSTQRPQPVVLRGEPEGRARVHLLEGEHGVAPGQACVFYQDEAGGTRVLGGGWIEKSFRPSEMDALTFGEQPGAEALPDPGSASHQRSEQLT
jgi:tRNA-specific 2-thiouridylase